jgi:hypothetical protein
MTGPVGVGYQDWGRTFATSRLWSLLAFNTVIVVSSVLTTIPTVNIGFLGVRLFSNVNHGFLVLDWFADAALTQFATTDTISLRQGGTFDQSIVVKAAFCRITAFSGSAGNWTMTLLVYEATYPIVPQLTATDNVVTSQTFNLGAGLTSTVVVPRVVAAPAFFYVVPQNTALWFVNIEYIDANAATARLFTCGNINAVVSTAFFLPACNIQVKLTNQDAAAKSFEYAVTTKPLYA